MSLKSLFGSEHKECVLQYIFKHNSAYGREISNFYGISPSAVQKQLLALARDSILTVKKTSKNNSYSLNPDYIYYNMLKNILTEALPAHERFIRAQNRKKNNLSFKKMSIQESARTINFVEFSNPKEALEAVAKLSLENYSMLTGIKQNNIVDKSIFKKIVR